jgi:hypothetical protein
MMGATGALVFVGFLLQDPALLNALAADQMPWGLVIRYVVAMFLGGALAGVLLSGLFGRRGVPGFCLALLAGLLVALFAGLLGSAAGLLPDILSDGWQSKDAVPILAGLLVFPLAVLENVWLLPIWLVLVILCHRRASAARD